MRLGMSKSKNSTSLYVIKSTYENKKHSSKIVEKLGTVEELNEKLNGQDPIAWAKEYIAQLNEKEKAEKREILVSYSPAKQIAKEQQKLFNGGYLFLQQLYTQLGLPKLCRQLSANYKFAFDLNSILSRLLYARLLFPASKLATMELSQQLMEPPNFELHHIYRALEVLAKETDTIQAALYQNSLKIAKRNTGVIYYDCTNYFFEIEQEEGLKQYGYSKEHRPNPLVQMGLFMDGDGIPLAFSIHKGNTNEQLTLKPLEKKLLKDFSLSPFVVCTDAGLASQDNREFNNQGRRAFITTQSLKKLKKHLQEWALGPTGWRLSGEKETYDLTKIDEESCQKKTFYKERWIKENGLEQKLIVTYSLSYRDYQKSIRSSQLKRAEKALEANPGKLSKKKANDYKRFIVKTCCTKEGEVASQALYHLDDELVAREASFDGFYALCTNLEDDGEQIIKINHRRWEIEECFRIMKSEFKARPVYLSRDDRITAHFTTCFLTLILYRFLEKKLDGNYTCREIIQGLREMNFLQIKGEGYIPTYKRTEFTDALHEAFGFRTDYQVMPETKMKKLFKDTKRE